MSDLRRVVKNTAAKLMCQLSIDKIVGQSNGLANRPLIICYHRVVRDFKDASNRAMPSLLISTDMFEKQLDWLLRRYRMVSIDEILMHSDIHRSKSSVKNQQLATITFDDGYADFYFNAFPILKRKGIPSSVFVVTNLIGSSRLQTHDELYLLLQHWLQNPVSLSKFINPELHKRFMNTLQHHSDPYHATRHVLSSFLMSEVIDIIALLRERIVIPDLSRIEMAPLDWDMLRELSSQGVTIGSHTHSHALLPTSDQDVVESELRESRLTLERELGIPIKHLAYPDGQFDERVAGSVESAGYSGAYAICNHQSSKHPKFTVPRRVLWQNACVDEHDDFSPSVLSCLINGVFERPGQCSQDHGRT